MAINGASNGSLPVDRDVSTRHLFLTKKDVLVAELMHDGCDPAEADTNVREALLQYLQNGLEKNFQTAEQACNWLSVIARGKIDHALNGSVNGTSGIDHANGNDELSATSLFQYCKPRLLGSLIKRGYQCDDVEEALEYAFIRYLEGAAGKKSANAKAGIPVAGNGCEPPSCRSNATAFRRPDADIGRGDRWTR